MTKFENWNHFIRPSLWAFFLAIYLIGALSSGSLSNSSYFFGAIVAILLCTSSITINHYFDYETDRKSRQLYRFPVAAGKISREFALFFSAFAVLLSIAVSYHYLNAMSFYLTLFANFMVLSYSAPPFRIKEMPYFETFWNGIGYGWIPYYLALFISGQLITVNHHLLGLIPFLVAASGHILLQVRDIEDDTKGGVKTTSTKLGLMKMKRVSGAMVAAAGLIIIYLASIGFLSFLAWFSVIAGVFIGLEHRRMKNDVTKSYRRLQIAYILGGIFFMLSVFRPS